MFGRLSKIVLTTLFVLCFSAAAMAQTPSNQTPRKEGEIWFEPVKTEIGGQTIEAEFGHLIVRENRNNPKSNLIELAFVRLKSTAEKPGYPVVYLDGGPGSSAISIARVPE